MSAPHSPAIQMDVAALNAFLGEAFPHATPGSRAEVTTLAPGHARLTLNPGAAQLRPGGIVSGPTLMGMADTAAYALVLAHIGPQAMAVTTALNYQFLRPCPMQLLTADALLMRLGRRLANADIRIWAESPDRPVGQAIVTYALP